MMMHTMEDEEIDALANWRAGNEQEENPTPHNPKALLYAKED